MTTFYDVPAEDLYDALADRLAEDLEAPPWATFAKTGVGRELPPEQAEFWERRAASVLKKVAESGPIGVERLRSEYGSTKQGSTRYRTAPPRSSPGSGKIVRTILQQLGEADYVERAEGEGRRVSGEGRALLDEVASEVIDDLDRPELERYA